MKETLFDKHLRNTFWVFSNELFELGTIVMEENRLSEANSPEEVLLLFQLFCKSETFFISNILLYTFTYTYSYYIIFFFSLRFPYKFCSLHCYIEF